MDQTTADLIKTIAVAILGGGLGTIGTFFTIRSINKKTSAEAKQIDEQTKQQLPAQTANVLIDGAGDLVERYQVLLDVYQKNNDQKLAVYHNEVCELKKTIQRYGSRIAYLMNGIQMLLEQMQKDGIVPCWTPNDWKPEIDEHAMAEMKGK